MCLSFARNVSLCFLVGILVGLYEGSVCGLFMVYLVCGFGLFMVYLECGFGLFGWFARGI